jgi:hypothetical protein
VWCTLFKIEGHLRDDFPKTQIYDIVVVNLHVGKVDVKIYKICRNLGNDPSSFPTTT